MKKSILAVLAVVLILSGCSVRSISDSGYKEGGYYGHRNDNPFYKGELSEFDVLGIEADREISEQDILAATAAKKERMTLRKGDSLMVIQSGAMLPDEDMTKNMEKYFSVTVFTDVPETNRKENTSYARALRFAAAKSGIEKIFVYWGVLESGTRNLATKTISWVPIIGGAIPDQTQEIRIRLKVALIDVKSGQWEMFSPKVYEDTATSGSLNRAQSDQAQVAILKTKAYETAVENTITRYVR